LKFAHRWFVVAAAWAIAATAPAAPPFAIEGLAGALRAVVVAEDAGRPVSAFEVLLYLDMTRHPDAAVPTRFWLMPSPERNGAVARRIERAIAEYLAVRSLSRQGAAPPMPPFVRRSMLHGAAAAAWIEVAVRPRIQVLDADVQRYYLANAERYADPGRAQVRYIFLAVPEAEVFETRMQEATRELQALRDRIESGEIGFEVAARQHSQAPSAAHGGLIPEFVKGARFAEFDRQTFLLSEPGRMSPVFAGNGGVYLLQSVSIAPPSRAPLDAKLESEIRARLADEHVSGYFDLLYRELAEAAFTRNQAPLWGYADLEAPIAIVGQRTLKRAEFLQLHPSAIRADYTIDRPKVARETAAWIEGELISTDLEARGASDHPYLIEAGGIAEATWAARSTLRRRVDPASVTTDEGALRALGKPEGLPPGVPEARVVQFSLSIDARAVGDPERVDRAWARIGELADRLTTGSLPIEAVDRKFGEDLRRAAEEGEAALSLELERLRAFLELDAEDDVVVRVTDLGWRAALALADDDLGVVGLRAGALSAARPFGAGLNFHFVAGTRSDPRHPWLQAPARLRAEVFDRETARLLEVEIERLRSRGELIILQAGSSSR
jgi:hypothetical protein